VFLRTSHERERVLRSLDSLRDDAKNHSEKVCINVSRQMGLHFITQ
jgi:hypothetical protein